MCLLYRYPAGHNYALHSHSREHCQVKYSRSMLAVNILQITVQSGHSIRPLCPHIQDQCIKAAVRYSNTITSLMQAAVAYSYYCVRNSISYLTSSVTIVIRAELLILQSLQSTFISSTSLSEHTQLRTHTYIGLYVPMYSLCHHKPVHVQSHIIQVHGYEAFGLLTAILCNACFYCNNAAQSQSSVSLQTVHIVSWHNAGC